MTAVIENTTAPVAQSTYAHYDVMDTIENVTHPMLRAMVLGSMEWSVSAAIINLARDTFYRLRDAQQHTETTIDDFNEFINTVAELKANEQYNQTLGFEENGGAMQQLALLVGIKHHWYDLAEIAHGSAKMRFAPRTYEELIASEKVRSVDDEMKTNLEALAAFASRGDAKRAEVAKEQLLKQQQFKFASQHASRQLVAPAVVNIINMAEYRNAGAQPEFWQLPVEMQERLITSTRKAIERTLETLATWRGITAVEYATAILPDAFAAIDELDTVLKAPKFQ